MKRSVTVPGQRFTSADIFAHHPEPFIFETDKRYAKFANDLYFHILGSVFIPELNPQTIKLIVIKSTMYLEDIVSESGIWETFVTLHQEMFGKRLPFFECDDDYVVNEPNIQDIKYLIWSSAMESEQEASFNPCANWIDALSEIVYDYLDSQFEEVPINEKLRELLQDADLYDDLIFVRGLLIWLFRDCYLTKGRNCDEIIKSNLLAISESGIDMGDQEMISYEVKAQSAFEWKTGPLALYPKEFLAKLLRLKGCAKEADAVAGILYYPKQVFKVENADKDGVSIISTKKEKIHVSSASFGAYDLKSFKSHDGFVSSLIKYKDEFQVNGVSMFCDVGDKFESLYDNQDVKAKGNIGAGEFDKLMKLSCDTGLLFFNDVKEYLKLGVPEANKAFDDDSVDNIVCYVDKESMTVLTFSNVAQFIASPNNPFYDKETAVREASRIVTEPSKLFSPLLMHLISNNLIPDAKFVDSSKAEDGNRVFQDNIEFIARYMQQHCWLNIAELSDEYLIRPK